MKNSSRTSGEKPEQTSDSAPEDSEQDAVALLKSDHRKVEELFNKYQTATSTSEKARLTTQICRELIMHTMLEEELFYPACRDKDVEHDDLDEAQVEHDSAKVLIAELMMEKPGAEYFDAKVKVLSEYIKLHVGEEEDPGDGIFAKAQQAGVDMSAVGRQIQARKPQLLGQVEASGFNPPSTRSLHIQTSRKHSQETMEMPRYSQDQDRDERGRFVGVDERGYESRYRDNDDYRRGNGDHRRNEFGQFMRDDDDRGRGYGSSRQERNGDYRRSSDDRDRDEYGRFVSHDERGGMYSARPRNGRDDDYRGSGQYRPRDEDGRFMSDDDRGRYPRSGYDDDRNGGRGWYGDTRGHAEASRRGWEHRESGRYDENDDRRFYGSRRGRDDSDDHRGHSGWFGDPEGHAEASRRGWRNR